MIQFFAPDIKSTATLPQDESAHCVRVLRHRAGDEIHVIDGEGSRLLCRILDPNPRGVMVEIISSEIIPPSWDVNIILAVAPTKNMDRMEWLTEKAVEIGINRIVPIICTHSERKVLKTERLQKIAVSAMKQSLKTFLPRIDEPTPILSFIKEITLEEPGKSAMKFMGYCDKEYPLRRLIQEYKSGKNVVIMIGPEGDFSPEEVKKSVDAGFIPVTFGDNRLRTETAALVGIDMIHFINATANINK